MNIRFRLAPLAALAVSAAAFAQTAPAPGASAASADSVTTLDAVAVTGTQIRGIDTEKVLPVSVFSAQDLAVTGITTMAEFVEALPYSIGANINEATTGPNDARGDVTTVNLRNLGAGRSLVLLNGRRLSAYGVTPGTPPVQFVNLSAIPFGAIQQVEVLRDGASAIYGSDAIGGVMNTILRKRYEGFEANARYSGGSSAPDEYSFDLAGGRTFNGGRSSLSLFAGYYHRDLLMASERAYAANADKRPLVPAPFNTSATYNRLNSSSPYGRFTAVNDAGTAVAVAGVTATSGSALGQFYYDPTTGARGAGAGPTLFYNSQAGTQLLPELRRYNIFGTFDHELSSTLSLFGELSYYDSHAYGMIDATPVSFGTDGIVIPKTNYYNPVGTRFLGPGTADPAGTPRNVVIRNYRLNEIGPRSYDTYSDSYRLLAGLRGKLPASSWSWESAALYMRGTTQQVNHGYVSQSRFLQQLALSTPDAYNPFNPTATNPESVWRNFAIDIWDRGVGALTSFDGKVSGELFQLPTGAVSLAVGGEFRRESMKQTNDPFGLADDVVAQSEQLNVSARRDVYAASAEALIPLAQPENNIPLVRSLELRLAGRHEDYDRFSATKPGAGLSWRPSTWLMLRSSYNEGFRAPAIVELFTPAIGRRSEGFIDPARPGQPDAVSTVSKRVVTGGNRDLRPEESESYNYGVVVDVPFVSGLTLGADVYRIRQFNQIDNSSAENELALDARLWAADGGSNPRVIRAAPTASDLAAGIPGVLVEVLSTYQNLSLREVEGVDFSANYRTPSWEMGRFNLNAAYAYTTSIRSIDAAGNVSDLLRANGNPRVKATASLGWTRGSWSAAVSQRYTGDYMGLTTITVAGVPWRVDSYQVTNAQVGYTFRTGALKDVRLRVGVNNVFDRDPPLYPSSSGGYDSFYADPRGRAPYVDVSYKF